MRVLLVFLMIVGAAWLVHPVSAQSSGNEDVQFWTCSMHPQIKQPKFGQCPICAMDLTPVHGASLLADGSKPILTLSESARELARIEVTPVERKFALVEIRMVGKLDFDETRLAVITARIPGRLDRLFVDYTGIRVKKGDHLVSIYSPELLAAQKELIQTAKSFRERRAHSVQEIRESALLMLESTREKLRLLGFKPEQISEIEHQETPTDHIIIYSPMSGVVIRKNVTEGMFVETGAEIYTVADLRHLWVKLDAYESDLRWLRFGQSVDFETEAYRGEIFTGKIAFIEPIVNDMTRTSKVRVNIENTDGNLKPGMFVRARVHVDIAEGGRVRSASLMGKWISPMHPEIIKDHPGNCDVCGMPLVRAETLGYADETTTVARAPLLIPASAPLITGKRAVVYVENQEGEYEGREVALGARAGDYYIVQSGIEEGELVVTNGAFKIDSAMQIQAKPSMMNPANP